MGEPRQALVLAQIVEPVALAARVPAALARGRELVVARVEALRSAHHGEWVRAAAHGQLLGFSEVAQAVRFATELLRLLPNEDWPATLRVHPETEDGLTVRVGVHWGVWEPGKLLRFGPAVHQVARLTSVAAPGQVLLSEAACRCYSVEEDIVITDLGPHQLPGVRGATPLYQARAASTPPRQHAPLGTLDLRKTNLVRSSAPFFGRVGDLAALGELLGFGVRLLSLVGVEGVGKSRLVRQFAERQRDWFCGPVGGGVWMCDLSEARDVDGLVWALGSALDLPLTMERKMDACLDQIGDAIAARGEVLLVLDGADHLRDLLRDVLPRWLAHAELARVVVSARRRLGLRDEVAYELGPLKLVGGRQADPVRLFEARVRARRPDFKLDQLEDVEVIVSRVGCNPMSIELAAAAMGDGDAAALRAALPERGVRRMVRALGDLSWGTLDRAQQQVLARCAVFRGWFGPPAARAVVGVEDDVVPSLTDLVARGLVHADSSGDAPGVVRYALPPRIRDYAWKHLSRPERAQVQLRLASHVLEACESWAARWWRCDGPEVLARMALEWDHLMGIHRAYLDSDDSSEVDLAVRAALALQPLLDARGPTVTGQQLLESAIRASDGLAADPLLQVRALVARCAKRPREQAPRSELDLVRALAISQRWSDPEGVGMCQAALGRAVWDQGQRTRAAEHLLAAEASFAACGDHRRQALVQGSRGVLFMEQGDAVQAEAWMQRGLALLKDVGSPHHRAVALGNLAVLYRRLGRTDEARVAYSEALDVHRRNGRLRHAADLTSNLGVLDFHLGDIEAARARFVEALGLCRELGHKKGEAVALGNKALVVLEAGDPERARTLMLQSMALHRDQGEHAGEGAMAGYLGMLHHLLGQPGPASDWYGRSVRLLEAQGAQRFLGLFLSWQALLEAEMLRVARAEDLAGQARALLARVGDPVLLDTADVLAVGVELARARQLEQQGEMSRAGVLRARVGAVLDAHPDPVLGSDLRFAVRVVRELLDVTRH